MSTHMRPIFSCIFSIVLMLAGLPSQAQPQTRRDLWVTSGPEGWNIIHPVQKGETLFMLARRYHVPPAILADANNLTYNDGLKEHTPVVVPLGAYNLQTTKPANTTDAKALYYKAGPEDNLYRISRHSNVPQRTLLQWNNLTDKEVHAGQVLLVGWVLYDPTNVANPADHPVTPAPQVIHRTLPPPVKQDTPKYVLQRDHTTTPPVVMDTADTTAAPTPPVSTIEALFKEQTQNGQNIVFEKGSAAFFNLSGQAKGAAVFAFHNKAAKGSVIRVKNLNNGRVVFVKVLGPLPLTKQYYNCIIGLSGSAKAALGVRDTKAFCELSYAGY